MVSRVIHVIASINCDIGGPAVSVTRLAEALVEGGVPCSILTLDYPEHGPVITARGLETTAIPAGALARWGRGYSRAFARVLDQQAATDCAVIHNHGLWMYPNVCARRAARRHRIPLVISPRGMLEPWSLGRSRARKFFAWHCYERANLASAALFHATSQDELTSIRRAGLAQPVAVIPNGVDVPDVRSIPSRDALEARFPELRSKRWIVFLSRIHPKKGVSDLVRAWTGLAHDFNDVQLIVAGPEFEGYRAALQRDVQDAGIGGRVTFTGMLTGDDKASVLANADLFVLPTYSENFGMSIAEALAHGTPVITTTAAPWPDIRTEHCGWWIDTGAEALQAALLEALSLPREESQRMGIRGRQLVLRAYSWQRVAAEMKVVYEWVCHGGDRPDSVRL